MGRPQADPLDSMAQTPDLTIAHEQVVKCWVENPYWQYLCGEIYFKHELPIDPGSLSRFRKRISKSGCEKLLAVSIQTGVKSGTVKPRDFNRVTVDTTVQEKAAAFPTDSKLLNRSRERLVRLCRHHRITLRQSYARKGPQAVWKASRYAHARQMKRMKRELRRLRTYLGRVVRDIERRIAGQADLVLLFAGEISMARCLLSYSWGPLLSVLYRPQSAVTLLFLSIIYFGMIL